MTVPASRISMRISPGDGGNVSGEGKQRVKVSCSLSTPALMATAGEHGAVGPHGGMGPLRSAHPSPISAQPTA